MAAGALLVAGCGHGAGTPAPEATATPTQALEAVVDAVDVDADETRQAPQEPMAAGTPEIRAAEVAMGFNACCADTAFWNIPLELGWWDDLNITIVPNTPTYRFISGAEAIAWLRSGEGNVVLGWVPGLFGTLETYAQQTPPILLADIYVGYAVLVAPDSPSKTVMELVDEGMDFPDAAKAAVQQLVGADIHISPGSIEQNQYLDAFFAYLDEWWESYQQEIPALDEEGNPQVLLGRDGEPLLDDDGNVQPIRLTTNDWRNYANPQYLHDSTIVEFSAVPGRIEYAVPYSAPVLVQMMRNGWDPLINFGMMIENDPFSQQTAIAKSTVGGVGLLANRDWVDNNKDLVYRILSAAFRTFEFLDDPQTRYQGWEIEANLINSHRRLSLAPEDIGTIWEQIDPSFGWEDQEALWDLDLPGYHPEIVFATQIERLKVKGVLAGDYDTGAGLEEFLLARDLYYEMKELEARSDELFESASGMDLSPGQADLIARARRHYDTFNFYDALRFLEAALSG
ncbi:MAG: hypothetical protein F4196_07035 [Acidimicrobiia bacterium]|nr:hypothetical protein [Acidimicrobiia bacterium]